MRFTKFKLPLSVAAGLLTTAALATEPQVPSRIDPSLYDSFAQAEGGAAPVPEMPRPGVPMEDVYQYRAAAPEQAAAEEEATRYLETEFLTKRGIKTYGWMDVGIGANNWGAPWNGPITFNDRNWQGQMNQLYLVNEKTLGEDFGWGGRVDLLYGTDFLFTTARGLDGFRSGYVDPSGVAGPRWYSSRYYGLAMPQLYAELGREDLGVKFGHFYTLIGYEVVPAIGNFFYTHAYTMQYGEPFTHTGVLGTWVPNDQMTVVGGVTNGWDNWDDGMTSPGPIANTGYPGSNSNAAFLGAVTFKSSDEKQALIFAASSGNERSGMFIGDDALVGNRTIVSTVYTNELSDKLTYVFQNDAGWQFNGQTDQDLWTNGQDSPLAQWYGINQYMFWNFTDSLIGGMRLEWFRDNNGTRVISGLRNALTGGAPFEGGFQGNFWAATWGLNYIMSKNLIIRPELRYDWYTPDKDGGALPYGRNFNEYGQFYGGCDAIVQF
jgi:hypothetical protein